MRTDADAPAFEVDHELVDRAVAHVDADRRPVAADRAREGVVVPTRRRAHTGIGPRHLVVLVGVERRPLRETRRRETHERGLRGLQRRASRGGVEPAVGADGCVESAVVVPSSARPSGGRSPTRPQSAGASRVPRIRRRLRIRRVLPSSSRSIPRRAGCPRTATTRSQPRTQGRERRARDKGGASFGGWCAPRLRAPHTRTLTPARRAASPPLRSTSGPSRSRSGEPLRLPTSGSAKRSRFAYFIPRRPRSSPSISASSPSWKPTCANRTTPSLSMRKDEGIVSGLYRRATDLSPSHASGNLAP